VAPHAAGGAHCGTYTSGVTPARSTPTFLCLHGLRLIGGTDAAGIAVRYGLDPHETKESLLDFEAMGWATHREFADRSSWYLTASGRLENERQLAAELDAWGGRESVARAHSEFLPLNERLQRAATDWQLRPAASDPLAANDHTDFRWDDRVIESLASIGRRMRPVCDDLSAVLGRFDGYADRYATAITHVQAGRTRWVDDIEVDSCHRVWIQLHEDLIATLGLQRGQEV
jgi:hypothetical protein